jgi:hypothetical protein
MAAQADVLSAGKDTKFEVNVDVAAYYQTKKGATSATDKKDFLGKGLNQVEIKATHTLSEDISVFGEIEIDYDPISDDGEIKTDDVRLGVASKSMGRLQVGQFDNYFESSVLEAINVYRGDAATVANLSAGAVKARTVEYSHKIGDLTFALDYSFTKNAAKDTAATEMSNSTAVAAAYKLGNLTFSAGVANFGDYKADGTTQTTDSTTGFAATYTMGDTKLAGLYAMSETTAGVETKHTGFALTHNMGKFGAGFNYQVVDVSSVKRNEMGLSLGYKPYKGMELFLDMVKFDKAGGQDDTMEVGVKYKF